MRLINQGEVTTKQRSMGDLSTKQREEITTHRHTNECNKCSLCDE